MTNWIGMGLGFLLGYLVGFYKKKIDINTNTLFHPPLKARISKQEKTVYKKRKVYVLSVFAIFVLTTIIAFIVYIWLYRIISPSVFRDSVFGFIVFIIPGFGVGLFVNWLFEKLTN